MPKYIEIYQQALAKYGAQADRTHPSLIDQPDLRIYAFGLFSSWRHSYSEYPALVALRTLLESDTTDDQLAAITAIKNHFNDAKHKWNNHSFNSYLLNEIKIRVSEAVWDEHWKQFDKSPIDYFRGILFRGDGCDSTAVFQQGLHEKTRLDSLEDYIKHMNGAVGVSASKLFDVAHNYALPQLDPRHEWQEIWFSSYVYIIDYQGKLGIDLERTFKSRGETFAAFLSGEKSGKAEVNVIGHIPPEYIVGGFYVDRDDKIQWHSNPHYQNDNPQRLLDELKQKLPDRFTKELTQHALCAQDSSPSSFVKK